MDREFPTGFLAATTRTVMGSLFAISGLKQLEPQRFFGIEFRIGFSLNMLALSCGCSSQDRQFRAEQMEAAAHLAEKLTK